MSATKKKNKFLRSLTCDLIPLPSLSSSPSPLSTFPSQLSHGTKVGCWIVMMLFIDIPQAIH